MDTSKQTFKLVQNDVFDINKKDIQAVFDYPKIEGVGRCIKYVFPHTLDVREA